MSDCPERKDWPEGSAFDVMFIIDGKPQDIDPNTQWVYNKDGHTHHVSHPIGKPIPVTPEDPTLSFGEPYKDIKSWEEPMEGYILTEFDFRKESVQYKPLLATKLNCQAFGITLLQSEESLPFHFDRMVKTPYTYGVYAGYQSPYLEKKYRRKLLPENATDLEYHAFPHIFSSQDLLPLVTSVARWRKEKREIYLADLWVNPGDCLFIPPKHPSDEYVDMHGNRNSAFACWGNLKKDCLLTETTLANEQRFAEEEPHYHREKHPTVHLHL
jgi:hypothetical protein